MTERYTCLAWSIGSPHVEPARRASAAWVRILSRNFLCAVGHWSEGLGECLGPRLEDAVFGVLPR